MLRRKPRTKRELRITVVNRLGTTPNNARAADLFARILRSVREQTAERKKREAEANGHADSCAGS
jgi:hypothetical protein